MNNYVMRTRFQILTSIFLFFSISVNAQYIFRDLTISNGLSNNQIRSISMTPDKRMAIGTRYILDIYNGSSFSSYPHDRSKEYRWTNYKPPKEYYDSEGRIWLKNQEYLLLFDLNTNQFNYNIDQELKKKGINQKLVNLFIDNSKNYWFVTEDKTVTFYDIRKNKLCTIMDGASEFTRQHGIPREITQYKNLYWIIYSDGFICCWDYTAMEFIFQDNTFISEINNITDNIYISTTDKNRLYMCATESGDLWLMLSHGVYFYNRMNKRWSEICSITGYSNFFTCMDIDKDGNVWVGTSSSGLRFIEKNTYKVKNIAGIQLEDGNIIHNDIFSVFVDDYNGLWVGTLFKGLYYYHPSMKKFNRHHVTNMNEEVWSFLELKDGSILIGTGKGLFNYNPQNEEIKQVYTQSIGNNICKSLYKDTKGRIWVSTYFNGLYCIDGVNVRNYKNNSLDINSFPNTNNTRSIFEDKEGSFWVCSMGGLGKLDEQTGKIEFLAEKHHQIKHHRLAYSVYEVENNILMVLGDKGIYYYNIEKDSLWIPQTGNSSNSKFPQIELEYNCYYKDSRSLEWFGTDNGLRIWDSAKNKLYTTNAKGLQNNVISAILEDENNSLWISTATGIFKIDVKEKNGIYDFSIVNFDSEDGLQFGAFNIRTAIKASDGTFYFGGVNGFNSFKPLNIAFNQSKAKAIYTNLYLFNRPVLPGEKYNGRIITDQILSKTKHITLKHDENFITIEFAGLNYVNPKRTYFKYKLENFDLNWNEILTTGTAKVTYTKLPPGIYKLAVYTANNDRIWSDQVSEIIIEITPPFWATTIAFVIYILLFIGLLIYSFKYLKRRNDRKLIKQQRINEQKQKEELDQLKYRFFTNVSHEFRTPLTLIITPLETLLKQEKNENLKSKLTSIYNNARNLLYLVNQLLDFRKIEMQGEYLKVSITNVKDLLQGIYNQFEYTISDKGIHFTLEFDIEELSILADKDKIQKILNNLITNALKYTQTGGTISIIVNTEYKQEQDYLRISVADTGSGIPNDAKEKIFTRFFQIDDSPTQNIGSGIGLHLAKEYALLHKGELYVENQIGAGAVFILLIPINLHEKEVKEERKKTDENILRNEKYNKKVILIVEDNTEFISFLKEQLSIEYNIIMATNGEEGRTLAVQQLPDLIISDLMMPIVDGIELCRSLKHDIQTSHIPFILLTAKHSDDAKIDGYEAGADSYISKPFSLDVLLIRVKKLIEQQELRKNLFHESIEVSPSSITITSLDEELVKKALECVENNMDNTNYSVEDLSTDLGLSRVHLYRKLQSITGQSPSDFIRSIRLKRAAQLLIDSQLNVSEIAYHVGFNNPKYFTICFKDQFGMTPSQFKERT